jgi:hypothetical protein
MEPWKQLEQFVSMLRSKLAYPKANWEDQGTSKGGADQGPPLDAYAFARCA